ncbi:transposable element Tcb2 transposase [Trichonephila clavipes]|nr:transposable element Tcb2 transposase [Trichonephila clavipes]
MTAQRYVHEILQPHVLPLMQWLSEALFQHDNPRPYTARVSQDYLRTVATLPRPARSPDLSPIEHIWGYLGRDKVRMNTRCFEIPLKEFPEVWKNIVSLNKISRK